MFTTYDKNRMLGALSYTGASLHTSFPGSTGTSEVTGGTYARVVPTLAAASGGTRTASSMTWNVPITSVAWIGFWDGANFCAAAPNGGSPKEFTADPATDVIHCPAHGYTDGTAVVFYGGTPPTGITEGTIVYTRDGTTDTFKVAATAGGAAIDLTGAGNSGCQVSQIIVDSYGSASTHTIISATLGLPF